MVVHDTEQEGLLQLNLYLFIYQTAETWDVMKVFDIDVFIFFAVRNRALLSSNYPELLSLAVI